jgi:hypothetical protein
MKLSILVSAFFVPFSLASQATFQVGSKASNPMMGRALNVRGGDVKDTAFKVYSALLGIHGIVSLAAPDKTGKLLYQESFELKEGELSTMLMEGVGNSLLGVCIMAHLAYRTDMSATNIAAYGSLPCIYWGIRHSLKENFAKFGFTKGLGAVATVTPLVLFSLIHIGKGDTELFARILAGIPLAVGIIGKVAPGALEGISGISLYGKIKKSKPSGVRVVRPDSLSKPMFSWLYTSWALWGILAYSLLNGVETYKALGYSAAFFAIALADANFLRKDNAPLKIKDGPGLIFSLVLAAIAYGLLDIEF